MPTRSSSPTQDALPREGDDGIISDKVPYYEGPIWKKYATDLAQRLHVLKARSDEQLKQITVGETVARANGISDAPAISPEAPASNQMVGGGENKG